MIELLTESMFKIEENQDNLTVITVNQQCHDGLARVALYSQKIILTEYGLDALEKNLKRLLLEILRYKNKDTLLGITNANEKMSKLQ